MSHLWLLFLFLWLGWAQKEQDGKPVQLIAPDTQHETLLISPEAREILESITDPIAIVGVVGPLHSGKSFLASQLMGQSKAFELGPSVSPKTRGLWMWSKPIYKENPKGGRTAVIYLDSEGLLASNSSDSYDAKVFSITALLSSQLVYNSLRLVDQSSIEYLELLARRSQLFSVKSSLQESGNQVAEVEFPPLLWVVRDFIQDTQGKTPTQWLNELLRAKNQNTGESSALPKIFQDIKCSTLFFPETDTDKLRHLDQIPESEYTEDYRKQIKQLRKEVQENVQPKVRKQVALTGSMLSTLLTVLVHGANSGQFPSVPSVWDQFIRSAQRTAETKCIDYITSTLKKRFEGKDPMCDTLLQVEFNQIKKEGAEIFVQLTLGVPESEESKTRLQRDIDQQMEKYKQKNEDSLKSIFRVTRTNLITKLKNPPFTFPVPTKEFTTKTQELEKSIFKDFDSSNAKYECSKLFDDSRKTLQEDIRGKFSGWVLDNKKKIIETQEQAKEKTEVEFGEALMKHNETALDKERFEKICGDETKKAHENFLKRLGELEQEATTGDFVRILAKSLAEVEKEFGKRNALKAFELLNGETSKLIAKFHESVDGISKPQPSAHIIGTVQRRFDAIMEEFDSKFKKFDKLGTDLALDHQPYPYHKKLLDEKRAEELKYILKTNEDTLRLVTKVLADTKKQLSIDIEHYYLESSFREHALQQSYEILLGSMKNTELAKEAANLAVRDMENDVFKQKILITNNMIIVTVSVIFGLIIAIFLSKSI